MKLNLGCGMKPLQGYTNIDIEPSYNPDIVCDLGTELWPVGNDSADEAIVSHVLEHLPGESFFHFMRELYRVMKPGGRVHIAVPHPRSDLFLNDPTHYRPITAQLLCYFSEKFVRENAAEGRIFTPFYRLHGVDFDVLAVQYMIDAKLPPDLLEKIRKSLAFYEKHVPNSVFEIQIVMEAVK